MILRIIAQGAFWALVTIVICVLALKAESRGTE